MNNWAEYIGIALGGIGATKLWDYLRARSKDKTDVIKHQLDIEAHEIEAIKIENMELKKNIEQCENDYKHLEMETIKQLNELKLKHEKTTLIIQHMKTIIVNLVQDQPKLIKILNDIDNV